MSEDSLFYVALLSYLIGSHGWLDCSDDGCHQGEPLDPLRDVSDEWSGGRPGSLVLVRSERTRKKLFRDPGRPKKCKEMVVRNFASIIIV